MAEQKCRALVTEQEIDKMVIVSGGRKDVGARDLTLVKDAIDEAKRERGTEPTHIATWESP